MELLENNNRDITSHTNLTNLSVYRIILISIAHLTIGIGIIALSTYIPAELKFQNWSESSIAYLVGIATLFELSRLIIGYYGDSGKITYKRFFLLGLIISIFGLITIAHTIGSYVVLFGMISFTIGSAILSTIIDAYLISNSKESNKNKIAATTQFFRLTGFALGGILGVILYEKISFILFFYIIAGMHLVASVTAFVLLNETTQLNSKKGLIQKKTEFAELLHALKERAVIGMTIFLILYPIGLFAQDAVLEPFAIGILKVSKSGVGRMASIWGTATLLFIPLAILAEKRLGRVLTIFIGLSMASLALLAIGFLGTTVPVSDSEIRTSQNTLYILLFFFGAGLGLMTTPGTAMMFDICAHNRMLTTSLIAYFGIIVTLSRATAAFLAGIVLDVTHSNFTLLFSIEAIILFSSLFPLLYVDKLFKTVGIKKNTNKIPVYSD